LKSTKPIYATSAIIWYQFRKDATKIGITRSKTVSHLSSSSSSNNNNNNKSNIRVSKTKKPHIDNTK